MLQPPGGKPWLLFALLGASVALNIIQAINKPDVPAHKETPAIAAATPAAQTSDASPAVQNLAAAPADGNASSTQNPSLLGEATAATTATSNTGYAIVRTPVHGSLAQTFQEVAGDDGDALSAVFARLFVWDLDLRHDVLRADQIAIAWKKVENNEIDMPVAWLRSSKLGRTLKAYRFKAPGDSFASYWFPEGLEVPHRLVDGPLHDYQQITALLKDRPTHKGMDIKTPVGSPVLAPRDAEVLRENWSFAGNGNCLELRYPDGTLAKFLHLSENLAHPGEHVAKGQTIAKTGNTGHSTAPHLHYQLNRGDKVLDPIDYHGTVRRQLNPEVMASFQAEMARLDGLLGEAIAQR
jgi:murein DD-endopeptidase